jgi:hypothetical protein
MISSRWTAELLGILITVIFAGILVYILNANIIRYHFVIINFLAIALFLTFSRYILLLQYTPFAFNTWMKLILLFGTIPLFFYFIDGIYEFLRMLDEEGIEPYVNSDSADFRWNFAKFTKYQFLFFITGTLCTLIMLPVRMIVSIWRVRNKGTV